MADEDVEGVMEHIQTGLATQGVSCVAVSDGEVFTFSRECVQGFLEKMDESKQDRIAIFVKTGPRMRKV